jgi:hypothetical protein
MDHKPGCIQDGIHRVPIDCVTVKDLWDNIDRQRKEIEGKDKLLQELKARIYDLEHEEDYR